MTSIPATKEQIHRELQLLQTQKDDPKPLQPQAAFSFATRLFEIFGGRFSEVIRSHQLTDPSVFNQVHGAFSEIQTQLKLGVTGYVGLEFPNTAKLINKYRLESRSDEQLFANLKAMSYGTLYFPQEIVMRYKNPELGTLTKIEEVRKRAFNQLLARLKVEEVLEEKGIKPSSPPKPLEPGEELEMTKLYFGGGAIVHGRKVVYFSEMCEMWGCLNAANEQKRQRLLAELRPRYWAGAGTEPVKAWIERCDPHISWGEFLILCSIDAVKNTLKVSFSPSVEAVLKTKLKCEEVRSDLCCFIAELPRFYELDIRELKRSSAPLIRSFQLFLFLTRNFGLPVEAHNILLMILLHMSSRWDETLLPSFCGRRWRRQPPLENREISAFRVAREGLQKIVGRVAKREVSFSAPTPEDEDLFKTGDCWELLFFLWEQPEREFFITSICEVSQPHHFSMTLGTVLAFCRENQGVYTLRWGCQFPENYKEVVEALQKGGVEVEGAEYIFFDPPLKVEPTVAISLGSAADSTTKFVNLMSRYAAFPKGKEFCLMLRQFILHRNLLMFELLQDAIQIGAKPSKSLLWEALSKSHAPFDPEPIPTAATRLRAQHLTLEIQKAYQLADEQIFLIYLEVIRLIIRNQEKVFDDISKFVCDLVSFCPAVQKKDIFFLFLYHPELSDGASLEPLAKMRDEWVRDEDQLSRFVISREFCLQVEKDIEELVRPLLGACKDVEITSEFDITLKLSLLSAFFPPLQPLQNYFRITHITADGPQWGEPVWNTHLGQLKFILGGANIGIYLNWSIQKDRRPVLFMSFFNIEKREAFSAFIPLDVSVVEIGDGQRRIVFYGLLLALASQVLREKANSDVPAGAPETSASWTRAFVGVQETIDGYAGDIEEGVLKPEYIDQMWAFFRRVKLSYRNLFLSRRPPLSNEPKAVASQGHIFSSHPRGSLLPQPLLEIEPHPEWYIPDGSGSSMDSYRDLFATPTEKPKRLNLDLNMSGGSYPIFYHVQTADQVTGAVEERTHRNEVAPPLEQVQGRFVTLTAGQVNIPLRYPPEALENPELFQRYFDFHNLLLKSAVYNF